jgi:hypothetical protein
VSKVLFNIVQSKTINIMQTTTQRVHGKLYSKLLAHCQKQYKDIQTIHTAYMKDSHVYAIDYTNNSGLSKIASNTFDSDRIVNFK